MKDFDGLTLLLSSHTFSLKNNFFLLFHYSRPHSTHPPHFSPLPYTLFFLDCGVLVENAEGGIGPSPLLREGFGVRARIIFLPHFSPNMPRAFRTCHRVPPPTPHGLFSTFPSVPHDGL